MVDIGRADVLRVLSDVVAPVIDADRREGHIEHLTDAVGDAGGDHVVIGGFLLQHQPHGLDIVAGEAPIPPRLKVTQGELALQAE